MSIRLFARALSVCATILGCGPTAEQKAARSADSVVAIADSAGLVLRGSVRGRQLALMVHECKVFDLADAPRPNGRRRAVLETEFYPWPTVCTRQSIHGDTAWVIVQLGKTGLGAGGCCAAGGTYRSRDGRVWEREGAGGKWIQVGADTAQTTR